MTFGILISGAIPAPFDLAMSTNSSKVTKEYLLSKLGLSPLVMVIWVIKFPKIIYTYSLFDNMALQNTIASTYVNFWPKIDRILYPSLGNLATHIAIPFVTCFLSNCFSSATSKSIMKKLSIMSPVKKNKSKSNGHIYKSIFFKKALLHTILTKHLTAVTAVI